MRAVLRSPTFWLIGGSFFAVSYGLYGLTTFMVDYAHVQLGLPLERAGLLATVHGTAQVFGGLTVLPLSDRWGRRRTLLVTSSTIAAILLGVLLAGGEWRLLFVLVAALGFLYGPNFALFGACAGDYFPGELIGTVVGSWTPFFGLGAIGVHWVTGLLRDATGTYTAAFAINVVVVVVSVGLMAAVKRRVSEAGRQRPTRDVQREV